MRKLLSLLAITGIAGSASVNVVSCGSKSSGDTLKDITKMDLKSVTISSKNTAKELIDAVRTKIATYGGTTADKIQPKDSGVWIAIWTKGENPNQINYTDDQAALTESEFDVKIKVDDGNAWFNKTDGYHTFSISVNKTKNITDIKFSETSSANGGALWTAVRTQIARYGGTTADEIKSKDSGVWISIWNDKGIFVNDDSTTSLAAGSYNVKIKVDKSNKWFDAAEWIEKSITIAQKDLSTFNFVSPAQSITTGDVLWTEVRTQLATYAGITVDQIKASDAVKISILTGDTEINDSGEQHFTSGENTYDVKLFATQDQSWFLPTATWLGKTFTFNATVQKIDISGSTFTNPTQSITTGDVLWTEVRTQIATWSTYTTITAADIKAQDSNVWISIWNDKGIFVNDDSTTSLAAGKYAVNISVQKSIWFSDTTPEWISKTIDITV